MICRLNLLNAELMLLCGGTAWGQFDPPKRLPRWLRSPQEVPVSNSNFASLIHRVPDGSHLAEPGDSSRIDAFIAGSENPAKRTPKRRSVARTCRAGRST